MRQTEAVTVKLDRETKKKLDQRAKKERRKPGQMARILIEDGLKK